jgi:hypothetical protein
LDPHNGQTTTIVAKLFRHFVKARSTPCHHFVTLRRSTLKEF